MAQQQFRRILTQGEILGIFITREKLKGRGRDEIADEFGISPTHLSRLSKPDTINLPEEIMRKASLIFSNPESVFTDQTTLSELEERMNTCEKRYEELQARVGDLEKQNEILSIEKRVLENLIKN